MHACPDIDVLIELSAGTKAADVAVMEHAASCGRCQADLEVLGDLRSVLETKVPEELVAKVMASLPETPEPEPASSRPGWSGLLDRGIPFALGTATVAAALVMGSPAGSAGTLFDMALFSIAAGLLTSLVEPKVST